jgi:hypothetical protein
MRTFVLKLKKILQKRIVLMETQNTRLGWVLCLLIFVACRNTKETNIKNMDALYGDWEVLYISTPERVSTGKEMGEPLYNFGKDGQRSKSFRTPPHTEKVPYELKGDSIIYPNSKIPAIKITKLNKDSLILDNDKTSWHLYRKK